MVENLFFSFFSIETIVFALVVYFVVQGFRKIIEKAIAPNIAKIFPDKYEPWWVEFWREWVLPVAPAFFGVLIAFLAPMYPYPGAFATSKSAMLFFGMVVGMACGETYRFIKPYIKRLLKKLKTEEN